MSGQLGGWFKAIDEAIGLLMLIGDIDELSTGAGRGYAPTPPRRIVWGGADDVILGSAPVSSEETVRRLGDAAASSKYIEIPLGLELGRPAWRNVLVEIGGSDEPTGSPKALSEFARVLASSGERYSLDEPSKVAVLTGDGKFFGSARDLSGRWTRASGDGFYPAVIESAFTQRHVLLAISDQAATLWEPPSRDFWHWIIVGFTLGRGAPVWEYDRSTETFAFLTPPPRQALQAAILTGTQLGPWSWRLDSEAYCIIAELLGTPR